MHFIWNGLLSKAVVLQEAYGSKDLRFFGVSIGWVGFGFVIGIKRQRTPLTPDVCLGCGAIYNRPESTGCGLCGTPRGVAPAGKA